MREQNAADVLNLLSRELDCRVVVSEQQTVTVNRGLVGWLALVSLIGAAVAFALEEQKANAWQGIFTRVGIVLAALWLALPKDGRLGQWANISFPTLIAIVGVVFIVARNSHPLRFVPILAGLAVAARFLRPREQPRPPRSWQDGP